MAPECGHAFTAIRWDGANLIGRPYKFEVKHILEVLDEFVEQGLIKTKGKEDARLTYHDPCQIARKGGVIEQPRRLLNMVASNFVEMQDSGEIYVDGKLICDTIFRVPPERREIGLMFQDFASMVADADWRERSILASERTQRWLDAIWKRALENEV